MLGTTDVNGLFYIIKLQLDLKPQREQRKCICFTRTNKFIAIALFSVVEPYQTGTLHVENVEKCFVPRLEFSFSPHRCLLWHTWLYLWYIGAQSK